tara:strand:+ start:7697 stop:8119 length:423 start_codon:yes stop_codon:yes gene_type:complete
MTETTSGSCLCGAVTFQISGEFQSFFLCHCSRCRKDTGSAHAANLFSSTATISWLSGEDKIRTYRLPETRHEKSFCRLCGSALPTMALKGALLVVPAGSIDTPLDMRPTAHICLSSRAEWDRDPDDIPRMNGLPGPSAPE